MAAGATLHIKRAGVSSGAIGVKWIAIGHFIVSVAWKLAAYTHANDTPAWLDAFAAGQTIGIEGACHSMYTGKHKGYDSKPIFCTAFIHSVTNLHEARGPEPVGELTRPGSGFGAQ